MGGYGIDAVILEPESTCSVLDSDPAHGSVRQPLVKVISLMRSLDFTHTDLGTNAYPILRPSLGEIIGQMPYEVSYEINIVLESLFDPLIVFVSTNLKQPNVFSFFSPFFKPPGQFSLTDMVSPEA